jgi:hypothetical protein
MSITNPTDCEVCSVIWFLNTKNIHPAKIHHQRVRVYGEGVMNEGNRHKWCHLLNGKRTDMHNEVWSGHLSVITEDLKDRVDACVRENRLGQPWPSPLQFWPGAFPLPSFPKNERVFGSKWMVTDDELKETVTDWLNWLAADFYDERIVKLVQHLDKCLDRDGDYVEK